MTDPITAVLERIFEGVPLTQEEHDLLWPPDGHWLRRGDIEATGPLCNCGRTWPHEVPHG